MVDVYLYDIRGHFPVIFVSLTTSSIFSVRSKGQEW